MTRPPAHSRPVAAPAQNVLWFWYRGEESRRQFHGTPADSMRKFLELDAAGLAGEGVEIFLVPSRLEHGPGFQDWFLRRFREMPLRSVHIAESEPDFLLASRSVDDDLRTLATVLERLRADRVVVHAHHFRGDMARAGRRLARSLPGVRVLVENNGFDNQWGSRPENLATIFQECPEMGLCLDICHVDDFAELGLDDFMGLAPLRRRLDEIHFSYSTYLLGKDPYADRGYPGYGPFHALYTAAGQRPERQVREILHRCPVVIEGILPREDENMDFLRQELELAGLTKDEPCPQTAPSRI